MIYETIKDIAQKRHVPISRIEHDLGFSNGTLNKWNDSNSLPLGKVKAVAQYLQVDPYTLLLVGVDMDKVKVEND